VILQQDAFDKIDCNTPMERQKFMFREVLRICDTEFSYDGFQDCADFFKALINEFRQLNYSEWKSERFDEYCAKIKKMVSEKEVEK
jgi:V/A-type H+-transporting ATPase subunit A